MKLAKYKYTWLLKLAIFCYCQFLFCQIFLENDNIYKFEYGSKNSTSLLLYAFLFTLAPITEEIIYRGLYQKNKISTLFSFIFIIGSSFMLYNTKIGIWWIFTILTTIIFIFIKKKKSKYSKSILIIYSSILFTISHFTNTSNLSEIIQFSGNYFGGGLVLSWIALNFNLIKSIIFHFSYNIIVLIFFIFFTKPIYIKETNSLEYTIEEVSILSSSNSIKKTKNELIAKNANIILILANLEKPKNKKIFLQSNLTKFNMSIKDNIDNLDDYEILNILLEAKIIHYR